MQLNVCLSDLEQHNDIESILYTDVKVQCYYIQIQYSHKLHCMSNIMTKIKLHRIHSTRAGDENFNNKFYWSILYKKVYLS